MRYTYWILRFVPDVLRGEQVNVGVLVGSDSGDWAIRRVRSFRRANRIGGDAAMIEPWLSRIERQVRDFQHPPLELFSELDPDGEFSVARIERLRVRMNNLVQLSAPQSAEGATARETADFLFSFLVDESALPSRSNTRRHLVRKLQHDYQELAGLNLGSRLQARPRASVGRQNGRFDFAVVNDHVNQLSHVWSFDLQDADSLEQDIHAWNYLVTRIRNDGGNLKADKGSESWGIEDSVSIAAVFQQPRLTRSRNLEVYEAAREAWKELNVASVPSTEIETVALAAAS